MPCTKSAVALRSRREPWVQVATEPPTVWPAVAPVVIRERPAPLRAWWIFMTAVPACTWA